MIKCDSNNSLNTYNLCEIKSLNLLKICINSNIYISLFTSTKVNR